MPFIVDVWDGPEGEPIVMNGYTTTTPILFRDVVAVIETYGMCMNGWIDRSLVGIYVCIDVT